MKIIAAIPCSPGVAAGEVLFFRQPELALPADPVPLGGEEREVRRLRAAMVLVHRQLDALILRMDQRGRREAAQILRTQAAFLDDPELLQWVKQCITVDHLPAATAVWQVAQSIGELFTALDDDYMRARKADLLDVGERVALTLTGQPRMQPEQCPRPCVLVGRELSSADVAALEGSQVKAVISRAGSPLSHAAILARGMNLPAVVQAGACDQLLSGELVVVDGDSGQVLQEVDEETLAQARLGLRTPALL